MRKLEDMKFYKIKSAAAVELIGIPRLRELKALYDGDRSPYSALLTYALKTQVFNEYYVLNKTVEFILASTVLSDTTVYKYIKVFAREDKIK